MAEDQQYQEIAAWLTNKYLEVGRPIEQPEFDQAVRGLKGMLLLAALPNESTTTTLQRVWQHLMESHQNTDAKRWSGRVTEMEPEPESLVRVYESCLVSPLGECEGITNRMKAAGITAVLWRPQDHTGEAIYVRPYELEAARKWLQDNIFAPPGSGEREIRL